MDPEQYADAVERLELEYLEGGVSADEYMRRRHELEERASMPEDEPEPAASWEPMSPEPHAPSAIHATGDPATGAPLASWGRRARGADADRVSYLRALGRAASTWFLGLLFFPILLAYLWPLWDKRNQTLYDKIAGTIVVRVGGEAASAD